MLPACGLLLLSEWGLLADWTPCKASGLTGTRTCSGRVSGDAACSKPAEPSGLGEPRMFLAPCLFSFCWPGPFPPCTPACDWCGWDGPPPDTDWTADTARDARGTTDAVDFASEAHDLTPAAAKGSGVLLGPSDRSAAAPISRLSAGGASGAEATASPGAAACIAAWPVGDACEDGLSTAGFESVLLGGAAAGDDSSVAGLVLPAEREGAVGEAGLLEVVEGE